ncbi:MAG: hypothetical protein JNL10_13370 [Verrucomicrobiales bacterium]|nr:hypothetical protein [Verrucomicrobiales bacterium]
MKIPDSMTTADKPVLRLVDDLAPAPASVSRAGRVWRFWTGLLWGEWFAHSRLILGVVLVWLVAVWFLPIVAHPSWILALGGVFGVVGGPVFGGTDVMGGCEEYSFSQPATRRQRFDARLVVALGCLLAVTFMNIVALQNNLTDLVLSFFVSTGIAVVELRRPEFLYGVVLVLPLAALAVGFSVASLATTRAVAYTAWVWGALGALTGLRAGLSLEDSLWERLNGRITIPLLLAIAAITLGISRRLYVNKEAGRASSPLRLPLSGWAALGAAALAGLGVALLLTWFVANFARLL